MSELEELQTKQNRLVDELDHEAYELYIYQDSLKLLDKWYDAKRVAYVGRRSFSVSEEDAAAMDRTEFGELLQNAQILQNKFLNFNDDDKQLAILKTEQNQQMEDHEKLIQSVNHMRCRWESIMAEFAKEHEKSYQEKLDLKNPELVRTALQQELGMQQTPVFDVKELQHKQKCLIRKMDETKERIPVKRKSLTLMKELCANRELGPVARRFVRDSSFYQVWYISRLDTLQTSLEHMGKRASDILKPEAEALLHRMHDLDPEHTGRFPRLKLVRADTPDGQRKLCQLHFLQYQQNVRHFQETLSVELEIGSYETRVRQALNREYGEGFVGVTTPTFDFIRALENEVNRQKSQPVRLDGSRIPRTQSVTDIRASHIKDMESQSDRNHTRICAY